MSPVGGSDTNKATNFLAEVPWADIREAHLGVSQSIAQRCGCVISRDPWPALVLLFPKQFQGDRIGRIHGLHPICRNLDHLVLCVLLRGESAQQQMGTSSTILDTGYDHFDAGVWFLGTSRDLMATRCERLSRSI